MSGNFVSDCQNCDIYGKSPQFHEIIQRRFHTLECILSMGYMGSIFLTSINLFLIYYLFVLSPQMLLSLQNVAFSGVSPVLLLRILICHGPDGGGGGQYSNNCVHPSIFPSLRLPLDAYFVFASPPQRL